MLCQYTPDPSQDPETFTKQLFPFAIITYKRSGYAINSPHCPATCLRASLRLLYIKTVFEERIMVFYQLAALREVIALPLFSDVVPCGF
ncbi:MAG: hypothetical protein E7A34_00300, partial [Leclercia adecarboxylata]|nr:hypothetical protein [Leclercia adecarboxylata]